MKKDQPPKKPRQVPAEAVFNARDNQWELGKRDAEGKRTGEWKYWWGTTGHLCCVSLKGNGGKKDTFTRFHPDGTYSRKGIEINGSPAPNEVIYRQKSKRPTTELALTGTYYEHVFRVEQTYIREGFSTWKHFDAKGRRIELDGTPMLGVVADRHETAFLEGWDAMLTGQHANADAVFGRILEAEPKHFFASFGRLAFLAGADGDETTIQERLEIARAVLASAPKKPSGSLQALAIRFAANTLARESLRGSPTEERLLEGLRWAEHGAKSDALFDHAPAGTISAAIAATRVKLLLALGRDEKAYRLVQEVLDAKPHYEHFASIQGAPGFQAWQAKRRSGKTAALAKRVGNDLATDLNLAMLTAVDRVNQNKKHVPLDRKLIDTFQMQATRGSKTSTVPLPPSLKALLAYDFGLNMSGGRFFEDLLGRARPKKGAVLLSTTMMEVFRSSSIAKAYRDLKKKTEADMPGLVEVPLGADQRVFVYVAKTNADGEYPIVRFDEEPCIWASSGCLQDEIGSATNAPIAGAEARKEAAKEAVAPWMAREPEQRFVETDDDDDD